MLTRRSILRTAATVLAATAAALACEDAEIVAVTWDGGALDPGERCGWDCGGGWAYSWSCFEGGKCCGWYNCNLGQLYAGCCYGGATCNRLVAYPNWGCNPAN